MSESFKQSILGLIGPMRAYALALARTSGDADDLVQEALLRAWKFRASFREGTNLKAWLFQILRNVFYNEVKRRGPLVQDVDGRYAADLTVDAHQQWRLEYADVLDAIQMLSPPLREALVLMMAGDLTYEEAAGVLGCPVGTAKSRVHRARSLLVQALVREPGMMVN